MTDKTGTFTKYSPVDGAELGVFPIGNQEHVDTVVAAARRAQPAWQATPLKRRLEILDQLRGVITRNGEEYARRISADTGKPLGDSLVTELMTIPLFIEYYSRHAADVLGRHKTPGSIIFPGKRGYIEHFPMGVIGVISPWNFPFNLSVVPMISALIGGNTVVLKPSEVTPITGEVVREMFAQIDLPEGAVGVVQGDGSTGAALVDADIDKIFFTGSVATGRKVMQAAAKRPIPAELELGGKDAMIVCHDANIERAARAAVWGGFVNAGQMCISVERLFVVDAVYTEFVEKVTQLVKELRVGGPDEDADMGPLTFPSQIDTVEHHLKDAREQGARIVTGGCRLDRGGQFFAPTVVLDVTTEMEIYKEETFGPVLPIIRVSDEHEALRMANDHKYGLNGSVWTRDVQRGIELASKMECGQCSVNDLVQSTGNPALPFGGVKQSGIGRYHGKEGLLAFMHTKSIFVDRGWLNTEPFWFPYAGKYPALVQTFEGLLQNNYVKATAGLVRAARRTMKGH